MQKISLTTALLFVALGFGCSVTTQFEIKESGFNREKTGELLLKEVLADVKKVYTNYNIFEEECYSNTRGRSDDETLCRSIRDVKKPLIITVKVARSEDGWIVSYYSNGINDNLDRQALEKIHEYLSAKYGQVAVK